MAAPRHRRHLIPDSKAYSRPAFEAVEPWAVNLFSLDDGDLSSQFARGKGAESGIGSRSTVTQGVLRATSYIYDGGDTIGRRDQLAFTLSLTERNALSPSFNWTNSTSSAPKTNSTGHNEHDRNPTEKTVKSTKLIVILPLITVWLQVRVLPGPPMKSVL